MIKNFNELFDFTCPFCDKKDKSYCREDNHIYANGYILFCIDMYYCAVDLNNKIEIFICRNYEEDLLYTGYIDSSDKENLVKNMKDIFDKYLNNLIFL